MAVVNNVRALKRTAYSRYRNSSLWYLFNPRRIHAYCVGTPKSGTHSMEGLFRRHYRADHEPESQETIELIFSIVNGTITPVELNNYIRQRDRRLWLELDSSHLNYFLIDMLVQLFPQAKFVLTIRDCYSWSDSFINHQLSRPATELWRRLRDLRFGSELYTHMPGEAALAEHGLYTLDGYLSYWAQHNHKVLTAVPPERLLVVRTHEIRRNVAKIASFLNVPVSAMDANRSHSFKAKEKYGLLAKVDPALLAEKVDLHCGPLMARFFPEIRDVTEVLKQ